MTGIEYKMPPYPLGFALIPEKRALKYICGLNRRINEAYPSEFVLKENGNLLPHVSLFHGVYAQDSMENAVETFERICEKQRGRTTMASKGINVWATRIFFLDVEKESLRELHEEMFHALYPLRDMSAGSTDPQAFAGLSKDEEESLRLYKTPLVLKSFRPHFTIGRSESLDGGEYEFAKQIEKEMPPPEEIVFDRFVVFDVGKYGRLESLRCEFPLL